MIKKAQILLLAFNNITLLKQINTSKKLPLPQHLTFYHG